MNSFIRFWQDALGYFMEKISTATRVIILGAITALIIYFGSFQLWLNVVAAVLWIISGFMFFLLIYNLIRDRNKKT